MDGWRGWKGGGGGGVEWVEGWREGGEVDDGLSTQIIRHPTFPSQSTVPNPRYLADYMVHMSSS